MNELAFFETGSGSIEVRIEHESVWLSQEQMARLFERERSVITKHLRNVFRDEELVEESVCAKFAQTAGDGKTYQTRFFNLDAILSVGYRVNSKRGVQFRQWASRILKDYLVRGYALDRQRLEHNARELEAALRLVRRTLSNVELAREAGSGLAEIVVRYTQTFLWLQRYDEGLLTAPAGSPGGVLPTLDEAQATIARLKADLMARGEASELFGRERGDAFAALLGNLDQSVFGESAYPTVETKAAHLLYFVIKNHPFSDGNKRSGAFLFVDFLARNGRLLRDGVPVINDVGLAALALLVAESDPKAKDVMTRLIENMLALPIKGEL